MGLNGGMEAGEDDKKKKINQDVMLFLRKRSETEAPRYAARLKTYVNLRNKRQRAAAARRHSEQLLNNERSAVRKKKDESNKTLETTENRGMAGEERAMKRRVEKPPSRVVSRSPSGEPKDRCGRRRRRRRSCCRKKRRRRRSCSRRRRRRSCRRRRKRRRRRRKCC